MLFKAHAFFLNFQDLSESETAWTRFCVETGDAFQVFQWSINVYPKYDGSRVMIKNMKLAACRFEYPTEGGGV